MTDFSFPTDLQYKALNKQVFTSGDYSIVPIRMMDRMQIMKWRNEQLYHLRQKSPLTEAQQDDYFKEVVLPQFDEQTPPQLLFSYLEKNSCIGYGGLVHIDWDLKEAEISFIMDTSLEEQYFSFHWSRYLSLLEEAAFTDLQFSRILTYAFDLRPKLYEVMESNGYIRKEEGSHEAKNTDKYSKVIIHEKLMSQYNA
jgi:hypothetical protein